MTTKHLVAAFAAVVLGAFSLEAKDTVFFVGCHPDDIENCLGLMLRMREKYDIQVIDFTRGENGCGPKGYADGTTAVKRIAEEREVCKAFGCEPIFLSQINHNGMAHAEPQVTAEIEKLIVERKPKAVFVNWPIDGHPDHVQCSAATMHAVFQARKAAPTELYFYEEPPGEGYNFNCHCYYVDVSEQIDEACALCCKWACQHGDRIAKKKRIRLAKHGATAPKPVAFAEVYTTFKGDAVPGGVLEEFAISKTMKPVTWSPDMRWWYKDEFETLFPPKRPAKH